MYRICFSQRIWTSLQFHRNSFTPIELCEVGERKFWYNRNRFLFSIYRLLTSFREGVHTETQKFSTRTTSMVLRIPILIVPKMVQMMRCYICQLETIYSCGSSLSSWYLLPYLPSISVGQFGPILDLNGRITGRKRPISHPRAKRKRPANRPTSINGGGGRRQFWQIDVRDQQFHCGEYWPPHRTRYARARVCAGGRRLSGSVRKTSRRRYPADMACLLRLHEAVKEFHR